MAEGGVTKRLISEDEVRQMISEAIEAAISRLRVEVAERHAPMDRRTRKIAAEYLPVRAPAVVITANTPAEILRALVALGLVRVQP